MTGRVFLVGAGPGDPRLITRRGLELLRSCDVVIYDRLVAPELLDEAPPQAERVFAGKKAGEVHSRQVVIDALLIARAKEGKTVVRLKGGDPFVFGRGGEEALLLADAGIDFEIVPGVTSAIGVPSYAGIPVTHRGVASSFAVVTGREGADQTGSALRWRELATGPDTLVLLMGVGALRVAAKRLIEEGRPADQPAALIQWGTTARQRTIVADLASIADVADREGIAPPATAVVGDVVMLRDAIAWFEKRPLFGTRVVVTRPRAQSQGLVAELEDLGASVLAVPAAAIEDPGAFDELDAAAHRIAAGDYDWVVFASLNAVDKLFERVFATGHDARSFAGCKIAAVGPTTEEALRAHGLSADLVPQRFTGDELANELGDGSGTVLLPRVADAPRTLVDALEAKGWRCDEVVAYRNVLPSIEGPVIEAVRSGDLDAVTFTSASTARNLKRLLGEVPEGLAAGESGKFVACIGPATAEAARDAGFRVDAVAADHTIRGLVDVLVAWAARLPEPGNLHGMGP